MGVNIGISETVSHIRSGLWILPRNALAVAMLIFQSCSVSLALSVSSVLGVPGRIGFNRRTPAVTAKDFEKERGASLEKNSNLSNHFEKHR